MSKKNKAKLIQGSVDKILISMTIPMVLGIFSMVAFNLIDTFFVGRLGTNQLAALSFTFPVILVVSSIALGLGVGASSVISRAVGEGNHDKVKRLTTDSLILSLFVVVVFVIIGFFTINPLFKILGANTYILPYIIKYMRIWYAGMIFVVVPMVGNNAIRATGDAKIPGIIMLVGATINGILDPLFIFGIGPFPQLGIEGAAIDKVIARAITMIISLYILIYKEKIITFNILPIKDTIASWKQILFIGIPTAATRILGPIALGIITRLIASYGTAAVAAFGVSSRIEFFSLAVIMALASVIGPFVGQNWGAGKHHRVKKGIKYSHHFSFIWGITAFVFLAIFARPIASIFSNNALTISTIVLYLKIAPLGYGLHGILHLSTSVLNVLNKPIHSFMLIFATLFLLFIPNAFIGSYLMGITGIFISIAMTYIISGIAGYFLLKKVLLSFESENMA
jgi:putative MATE family efflux protein